MYILECLRLFTLSLFIFLLVPLRVQASSFEPDRYIIPADSLEISPETIGCEKTPVTGSTGSYIVIECDMTTTGPWKILANVVWPPVAAAVPTRRRLVVPYWETPSPTAPGGITVYARISGGAIPNGVNPDFNLPVPGAGTSALIPFFGLGSNRRNRYNIDVFDNITYGFVIPSGEGGTCSSCGGVEVRIEFELVEANVDIIRVAALAVKW